MGGTPQIDRNQKSLNSQKCCGQPRQLSTGGLKRGAQFLQEIREGGLDAMLERNKPFARRGFHEMSGGSLDAADSACNGQLFQVTARGKVVQFGAVLVQADGVFGFAQVSTEQGFAKTAGQTSSSRRDSTMNNRDGTIAVQRGTPKLVASPCRG